MRRWRKGTEEEDEELVFDDEAEAEDRGRPRSYARPMRTRFDGDDYEEDEGESAARFEELESKIRAGEYKPKHDDPWTAHILYQSLQDLGEI